MRRAILDLVRQEPGTRASVLADHLGIHKNAVDHHLSHLERIGAIRVLPGPCRRPVAPEHEHVHPAVLCPHARAILDHLWRVGGSSLRSLARAMGVSATKARAVLGMLEQAGFVVDGGAGRSRFTAVGAPRLLAGYGLSVTADCPSAVSTAAPLSASALVANPQSVSYREATVLAPSSYR